LTKNEIAEFFSHDVFHDESYVQFDGRRLYFKHPEAGRIDIEFPQKPERLPSSLASSPLLDMNRMTLMAPCSGSMIGPCGVPKTKVLDTAS
jgi:hypothetical protein